MAFTDPAFRQMMENIDVLILLLPCLFVAFFIFRAIYKKIKHPEKRKRWVSVCIALAITVVLTLILYFIVLIWAVSIRGRWCEGCMEYH